MQHLELAAHSYALQKVFQLWRDNPQNAISLVFIIQIYAHKHLLMSLSECGAGTPRISGGEWAVRVIGY